VNNTITLDVTRTAWSLVDCQGKVPPARSYHAACSIENLMVIHGGEGIKQSSSSYHRLSSDDGVSSDGGKLNQPHRSIGVMKGVCPGDNIQSIKLGPEKRVSVSIGLFI
jgi:hypothetical protein